MVGDKDRGRPHRTAIRQSSPPVMERIAWLLLRDGKVLVTRTKGELLFHLPGGVRKPEESEAEALSRVIDEQLSGRIDAATMSYEGTFGARINKRGDYVRMVCYSAEAAGRLSPRNRLAQMAWFTYVNYARVTRVEQHLFDDLRRARRIA